MAVGFLFAYAPDHRLQPFYDFITVTFGFPLLVYLALLVQPSGYSAVICRFLGAISYAVYTLHAPLSGFIEGLYDTLFHTSLGRYSPVIGVVFVLIVGAACVVGARVFAYPVRRLLLRTTVRTLG